MLISYIDPSLHCLLLSKLGHDNSLNVFNCVCHSLFIFFMPLYNGTMVLVLNKVLYCTDKSVTIPPPPPHFRKNNEEPFKMEQIHIRTI